jgi:hypothetical protein
MWIGCDFDFACAAAAAVVSPSVHLRGLMAQ